MQDAYTKMTGFLSGISLALQGVLTSGRRDVHLISHDND